MVECKDCKYCTQDDISSTRSEFRKGDVVTGAITTIKWCTKTTLVKTVKNK